MTETERVEIPSMRLNLRDRFGLTTAEIRIVQAVSEAAPTTRSPHASALRTTRFMTTSNQSTASSASATGPAWLR